EGRHRLVERQAERGEERRLHESPSTGLVPQRGLGLVLEGMEVAVGLPARHVRGRGQRVDRDALVAARIEHHEHAHEAGQAVALRAMSLGEPPGGLCHQRPPASRIRSVTMYTWTAAPYQIEPVCQANHPNAVPPKSVERSSISGFWRCAYTNGMVATTTPIGPMTRSRANMRNPRNRNSLGTRSSTWVIVRLRGSVMLTA